MSRWWVFGIVVGGQALGLFFDHGVGSVKAAAHWIVCAAFVLSVHWLVERK